MPDSPLRSDRKQLISFIYCPRNGDAAIMGGDFEASLLLVDELWDESLSNLTSNTFIACVPCRDMLAFCDSKSAAGVEKLREIVSRMGDDADHPISRSLYIRRDCSWHQMES